MARLGGGGTGFKKLNPLKQGVKAANASRLEAAARAATPSCVCRALN